MSGNCCTSEKERAVTRDSANCMLPSKNIGLYHIPTNRRCKFVNHPYPDLGSFPSPEKPDRHTLEIPKSPKSPRQKSSSSKRERRSNSLSAQSEGTCVQRSSSASCPRSSRTLRSARAQILPWVSNPPHASQSKRVRQSRRIRMTLARDLPVRIGTTIRFTQEPLVAGTRCPRGRYRRSA